MTGRRWTSWLQNFDPSSYCLCSKSGKAFYGEKNQPQKEKPTKQTKKRIPKFDLKNAKPNKKMSKLAEVSLLNTGPGLSGKEGEKKMRV